MNDKAKVLRLKFTIDTDASFEECNGESRPLTPEEYAQNTYRGCPDHPRAGSTLIDGTTSPNVVGCAVCRRTDYVDIPYSEYLAYYGNPDKHVYLGCIVERQCACCGSFKPAGSLWHIDTMIDSREYYAINVDEWIDEATARNLPGYLGEVANEQLNEVD